MVMQRATGGAGRVRQDRDTGPLPDEPVSPADRLGSAAPLSNAASPAENGPRDVGDLGGMPPSPSSGQKPPSSAGLMEQVREGAVRGLDAQKVRAAHELGAMVDVLRKGGQQLEGQHAALASYMDAAANQVDRVVGGLRDRDLRRLTSDVESFARRRPALFLGGAFALGLAAARFLKSSGIPDEPWRRASAEPGNSRRPAWPEADSPFPPVPPSSVDSIREPRGAPPPITE